MWFKYMTFKARYSSRLSAVEVSRHEGESHHLSHSWILAAGAHVGLQTTAPVLSILQLVFQRTSLMNEMEARHEIFTVAMSAQWHSGIVIPCAQPR